MFLTLVSTTIAFRQALHKQLVVRLDDLEAFAHAERWLLALRGADVEPAGAGAGAGRLLQPLPAAATCVGYVHGRLAAAARDCSGASALALAQRLADHGVAPAAAAAAATATAAAAVPARVLEVVFLPLSLFVAQSDAALAARTVVPSPYNAALAPGLLPRGVLLAETLLAHVSQPLSVSPQLYHQLATTAFSGAPRAAPTGATSTGAGLNGGIYGPMQGGGPPMPAARSTSAPAGAAAAGPGHYSPPVLPQPVLPRLTRFPGAGGGRGLSEHYQVPPSPSSRFFCPR